MVLIFQEKDPWNKWNSVVPVASSFAVLLLSFALRRRIPRYNLQQFRRGLILLLCGVGCFVRGLEDETDPFRIFHGCWHGFVGAAAYYNLKYTNRAEMTYSSLKYIPGTHQSLKSGNATLEMIWSSA
uniref:Uncharacterized protein n=1 Tax=Hyaloperonospora arabidopsidis (strain Emoy2) TaxID=559515 RepID=M4C0X1_HYAAE